MPQESATTAVSSKDFRHVIGHLASGVTVVTTNDGVEDFGMTASSVTSLSLDPPMMLACVNNAVPTADAIARTGRYAVNVLGQGHEDVAHQFAVPSTDKFRGVPLMHGPEGLPLLSEALAHITCEVTEQVVGGTHSIFLGQVVSASAQDGQPLTYFRGGFGRFEFRRNDEAYERARDLILSRVFTAGEVLTVEELAGRLEADRSTAFYALTRLSSDGLVDRDVDRGYVVAAFDVRTSDQTFDARLAIELGVIDLTIGTVGPEELRSLRRAYSSMERHLVGDRFIDFHAYLDANVAFHESIVGLAHNSLLTSTFRMLGIKNVMTRSFGATDSSSHRFLDVQRQLLEAFEKKDNAAARQAAHDYCALAKARAREILELTGGRL